MHIRGKKILCLCLIALNVAFIWGNSLMDGAHSAALSRWVQELLSGFLPELVPGTGEQGHGILRKLAHFSEFFLLGCLLRWLFTMYPLSRAACIFLPVCVGALIAGVDEIIQIFVPERGPALLDVGIDTLGVILSVVLISVISFVKNNKHMEETQQ